MRLTNTFSGRPAPWDRNPTNVGKSFNTGGTNPHTSTSRWVYTVPTARNVLVNYAIIQVFRTTAATTAALVECIIAYSNGPAYNGPHLQQISNVLPAEQTAGPVGSAVLPAATQLSGQTSDASTGGQMGYDMIQSMTEFDA